MLPRPRWELGTILYLKANTEEAGMLVGYIIRPNLCITYLVMWPENGEMEHWEMELTEDKNF